MSMPNMVEAMAAAQSVGEEIGAIRLELAANRERTDTLILIQSRMLAAHEALVNIAANALDELGQSTKAALLRSVFGE